MDRTIFAYLIIAAMIAVAVAAAVYYARNTHDVTDRKRIRREDADWRVRQAELDDERRADD